MSYNVQYSTISLCSSSCGRPLVISPIIGFKDWKTHNTQINLLTMLQIICKFDSSKHEYCVCSWL